MKKIARRDVLITMGLAAGSIGILPSCAKSKAEKGVLRVALRGGPDSLDPMKAEFATSALLFNQYLAPIVGYGKNGSAAPQLASSWTNSPDFKTWTFTIFPNLKWSDGTPLGVKDIVNSVKKLADKNTAYPDAPELFMIAGFKEAFNGASLDAVGIKAIGTDKVEFKLNAADASFPMRLQEVYPVPLHIVEKYGDKWTDPTNIVVSGPFILTSRTQTRLVFSKNPLGGWKPPMAERIDVEAVDDSSTRVRMFQSGDVDLAEDPPMLRYSELTKDFGPEFQRKPAPKFNYISLNTKKPQFANKDVRRALSMGLDRTLISKNIFRDAVNPTTRFVRSQEPLKYDVSGAQAIMKANGYSETNPLRFEIMVPKDERERAAIQIVNMWKLIYVEATIGTADSSAISSRLNGFDFDAAIVKVDKGQKSDPLDLMGSFASGGNAYSHQWKNPEFDKALEYALTIADEPARTKAVVAAEKFLLDEAPILPIWFADGAWLVSKRVSGGIEGMSPVIWGALGLAE